MDVALIGSDTSLGLEIRRLFVQWGRHRAFEVSLASARFRSERQAKKTVRRGRPDVVLDLRLVSSLSAGHDLTPADVQSCHWLAKACEHSGMLYLLLSADRVFSGRVPRPMKEIDQPDADDELGLALREAETLVRSAAPASCILRTGPVFSGSEDALMQALLAQFSSQSSVSLDDSHYFCPSSAADVARVTAAILDQVSVGADAQGFFHYASTDRTTRYGFGEVLLASAGQFTDLGAVALQSSGDPAQGLSRVLDCSRLRDVFAIKQMPWRGQINLAVKTYYTERQEALASA